MMLPHVGRRPEGRKSTAKREETRERIMFSVSAEGSAPMHPVLAGTKKITMEMGNGAPWHRPVQKVQTLFCISVIVSPLAYLAVRVAMFCLCECLALSRTPHEVLEQQLHIPPTMKRRSFPFKDATEVPLPPSLVRGCHNFYPT